MMRHLGKIILLAILQVTSTLGTAQSAPAPRISAGKVIANWRNAVHASPSPKTVVAVLTSTSTEDGIPGHVEEWITSSGEYRRVVEREFDNEEIVVTPRIAERRDWNGFVRHLEGEELSRLRTAIFETQVLAMGPPAMMSDAAI